MMEYNPKTMRFANPHFLWLLLLLPLWARWHFRRRMREGALVFPSLDALRQIPLSASVKLRQLPFILRVIAAGMLVIALARPQSGAGAQEISGRGIDIMMALDTSTSMDTMDMNPSRIEAAKNAMVNFIKARSDDRIGLVLFAASAFTRCPLTLDHDLLLSFIKPVSTRMVEDGTAIGMGIATAINRLKESKAKSQVIILLTDGMNNRGVIGPDTAADLAASEKIKIYSIGVGTRGIYYAQVDDPFFGRKTVPVQADIDDELLKRIAAKTGGKYFAVQTTGELAPVYEEINRLEKSGIKSRIYHEYTERFSPFVLAAVILLSAEWLLSAKFLRSLP